jgi:hypothetical protein
MALMNDHPAQSIAYYSPTILTLKDLDEAYAFIDEFFARHNIQNLKLHEYLEKQGISIAREYESKIMLGLICASDETDLLLIRDFKNKLRVLKYLLITLKLDQELAYQLDADKNIIYRRAV